MLNRFDPLFNVGACLGLGSLRTGPNLVNPWWIPAYRTLESRFLTGVRPHPSNQPPIDARSKVSTVDRSRHTSSASEACGAVRSRHWNYGCRKLRWFEFSCGSTSAKRFDSVCVSWIDISCSTRRKPGFYASTARTRARYCRRVVGPF